MIWRRNFSLSSPRWWNRRIATKRQLPLYRTLRMSNSSATATMPLLNQNRACQKLWKIFLIGWIYWQLTLTELTKLSMRCSTTVTNNYNLKIVGVPLISESESAQDTAELCVKLFSGLGVDVSTSEINIVHRVPPWGTSTGNGNRRQPNLIICKFTRRTTQDTVLGSRGNVCRITTEDLDLPSCWN